jgi:hypothetical protein
VSRAALQALTGNRQLAAFSLMDAARRNFPAIAAVWEAMLETDAGAPGDCIWLDTAHFVPPSPPEPPEPPAPG